MSLPPRLQPGHPRHMPPAPRYPEPSPPVALELRRPTRRELAADLLERRLEAEAVRAAERAASRVLDALDLVRLGNRLPLQTVAYIVRHIADARVLFVETGRQDTSGTWPMFTPRGGQ